MRALTTGALIALAGLTAASTAAPPPVEKVAADAPQPRRCADLAGITVPGFVIKVTKAVRVPVTLGYMDGQWVEVTKGLKAGERVVTAGKVALREGSAVQVVGGPAAKPADKKVADGGRAAGAVTPSTNSAR